MPTYSVPVGSFPGPYGSKIDVSATYDPDKKQACLVGKLGWLHYIQPIGADACVQLEAGGRVIVRSKVEISALGRVAARARIAVELQMVTATGYAVLGYNAEVCGSNTFQLKCRPWQGGTKPPLDAQALAAAPRGAPAQNPTPLVTIPLEQPSSAFGTPEDYLNYQLQYLAGAQNLVQRRTGIDEYLFELAEPGPDVDVPSAGSPAGSKP